MSGEGKAAFNKTAAELADTACRKKLDRVESSIKELKNLVKTLGLAWEGETAGLIIESLDSRRVLLDADEAFAYQRLEDLKKAIESHTAADKKAEQIAANIEQPVWADIDTGIA